LTLRADLCELSRRPFFRGLAVIAGGTSAAQAINLVFAPVLTRLYGPAAFGVLGVFLAVVEALAPVSTLAYGQAVVLPASDQEARTIVRLSLSIALCSSTLLLLPFGFARDQLADLLGFGASPWFLLLIPLVVLLTATEETLKQWLIRMKEFKAISSVGVGYAAVLNGLRAGFGLLVPTGPALLLENVAGDVAYLAMLWSRVRTTFTFDPSRSAARVSVARDSSYRSVAAAYSDFPMFRAPQALLNSVSQNIPIIVLAAAFGPVVAGFYALSRRVLQFPGTLIAASVGTVFLPRAARAAHEGEPLRPLLAKATAGLALVGIVPFGLVVAIGPWLFGAVFGADWSVAGEYARWLALWMYFGFVNAPCIQAIPLLGLQRQYLAYELVVLIVRVVALALGAYLLSSSVAVIALFSVCGALLNAGLVAWVLAMSRTRLREGLSPGGSE
jgi:O-antigen/teichoic acid export membrane protein